MDNTHNYLLSIPLNIDDLNHIPEGVLWEDSKFEDFMITKGDYDNLFNLFYRFNKCFDILIDEYEEEEISSDKIQSAIEMTEMYAANASADVKASAEKLLVALRRAKELNKPLELMF